MPKKPRQAHISQQLKRRKGRRSSPGSAATFAPEEFARNGRPEVDAEPVFADPPVMAEPAYLGNGPIATSGPRAGRRVSSLRAPQERPSPGGVRVVPGQLPTFERSYLMRELRQIGVTSTALLALIIVLTILLR